MCLNSLAILVSNLKISLKTNNEFAIIPFFKFNLRLLHVMYRNGLISAFEIYFDKMFEREMIRVRLSRYNGVQFLKDLKLVSKPSNYVYWSADSAFSHLNKTYQGIFIISTVSGLLTSTELCLYSEASRYNNFGGKVLVHVLF